MFWTLALHTNFILEYQSSFPQRQSPLVLYFAGIDKIWKIVAEYTRVWYLFMIKSQRLRTLSKIGWLLPTTTC